jgi:Xaa-Pro aminopeptidase
VVTRDVPRLAALVVLTLAGGVTALCACQSSSSWKGDGVVARPKAPAAHASPAAAFDAKGPELRAPRGTLAEECARRRRDLAAQLGGPCVIWVTSAPANNLSRFYQSNDFYYLSGVEVADVALALHVDATGALADDVLFLPPKDPQYETWNGSRLSPGPEAEAATGFRRTLPVKEEGETLASWKAPTLYVIGTPPATLPEGLKLSEVAPGDGEDTPPSSVPLRTAIDALRLRKSDYEIDCLANAITITTFAMCEAAGAVRPGAFEYEPQGVLEGHFIRLGSERPGFNSIFGSGPNSCTLHYETNARRMQDGDLLVMDVGAKWKYYSADVTRTLPVNGHFSPRQREVYQAVLDAQTAAFQAAKPGITMHELDGIARQVIDARGFGPGRKYFKHGLGHWIGLYVHDAGAYGPIEPGMLFTIEPGIYINEEKLGVRIEDDYLMTETGAVKLSDGIPSEPDAIEKLMAGG